MTPLKDPPTSANLDALLGRCEVLDKMSAPDYELTKVRLARAAIDLVALIRSDDISARVRAGDWAAIRLVRLSRWAMNHQPPMGEPDRAYCGDWANIPLTDDGDQG
jgi:hypothetical protein